MEIIAIIAVGVMLISLTYAFKEHTLHVLYKDAYHSQKKISKLANEMLKNREETCVLQNDVIDILEDRCKMLEDKIQDDTLMNNITNINNN